MNKVEYKVHLRHSQDKPQDGGIHISRDYKFGPQNQHTLSKDSEVKKLTTQENIPIFTQKKDPEKHIKIYKREWRKLGYKDEITWPHYFLLEKTQFKIQ